MYFTAPRKIRKLDPVGLAIGEELIKSQKRRREIIDDSFNRCALTYSAQMHIAAQSFMTDSHLLMWKIATQILPVHVQNADLERKIKCGAEINEL